MNIKNRNEGYPGPGAYIRFSEFGILDPNYKKKNKVETEKTKDTDVTKNEEEKDKFMALKTKEKTEFITQLLRNYEIKKFFNNIIYMESKDSNIISDKALKKSLYFSMDKSIFK